jgi:hypothetical protein
MEMEVLEGARQSIGRFHPILVVEHIKSARAAVDTYFDSFGYSRFVNGHDSVAIHPDDPTLEAARGHCPLPPDACMDPEAPGTDDLRNGRPDATTQ